MQNVVSCTKYSIAICKDRSNIGLAVLKGKMYLYRKMYVCLFPKLSLLQKDTIIIFCLSHKAVEKEENQSRVFLTC